MKGFIPLLAQFKNYTAADDSSPNHSGVTGIIGCKNLSNFVYMDRSSGYGILFIVRFERITARVASNDFVFSPLVMKLEVKGDTADEAKHQKL